MVFNIEKLGLITGMTLMIISVSGKCIAFPLPTADIKRIGSSVQVAMQQVMQIKQEIESNLAIAKEIQNGGYAAAAGDLFAKVQNGDYDRFGNNLKGLQDSSYSATHSAQAVEERKKREQAEREAKEEEILKKHLAEAKAGDALAGKTLDQLTEEEKKRILEEHKKANQAFYERSYNWVKNNRTVTDSALNTVNAAGNGDWSGIFEQGSISAGGIVGGANGSEISALGGVVSAGVDIVNGTHGDDLGEVITSAVTNIGDSGKLSGNLGNLGASHEEQLRAEEERKAREQEEAAKRAEEVKQQLAEQTEKMRQEMKQKMCNDCKADAEKNGRNVGISCISACSL